MKIPNFIGDWYSRPTLPADPDSDRMQQIINFWGSYVVFAFFSTITLVPLAGAFYWLHIELEMLHPNTPSGSVWRILVELPREFAIASAIAWALSFSVEFINRRRHRTQARLFEAELEKQRATMIKDLKENTFRAIYERTVSQIVFEEILKHLLLCKFFRRQYHIEILLRRPKPGSDRARLTIRQSFEVVNVSAAECEYPGTISLDKRTVGQADETQLSHFQWFRYEIRDSTGVLQDHGTFSRDELRQQGIIGSVDPNDPTMEILKRPFKLQPQYSALIDVTYVQYHPLDGADAFCCVHPADGMDIRVTIPDADFNVSVMAMHPANAIDRSNAATPESRQFVLENGIFPGQGIYYRWWPVDDPKLKAQSGALETGAPRPVT